MEQNGPCSQEWLVVLICPVASRKTDSNDFILPILELLQGGGGNPQGHLKAVSSAPVPGERGYSWGKQVTN